MHASRHKCDFRNSQSEIRNPKFMSPEISRRCLSCGASTGPDAIFCPECGQPLSQTERKLAQTISSGAQTDSAETDHKQAEVFASESGSEKTDPPSPDAAEPPATGTKASKVDEPSGIPKQSQTNNVANKAPKPDKVDQAQPEMAMATAESQAAAERRRAPKARETLHRASSVAKGALEDNVKRVEKIRQVSSVVLEEAHYDPSLRFVLVALGLFVLFGILLLLSKVMG